MSLYNNVDPNKLTIITNGDSWTFGSEIADPDLAKNYPEATHITQWDFLEDNDSYRIPRIWPTYLGQKLDADVVNLAWPADDNGSILRRTLSYISTNYIAKNISTENLLVVIGWSSPERNSFWYKDEQQSLPFRLWPNVPNFNAPAQEKFWELYVAYLWHPEEFIPRFVLDCLQFENFCRAHNIKFLHFNAFYQTPKENVDRWQHIDVATELDNLKLHSYIYSDGRTGYKRKTELTAYQSLWNTVNAVNLYKKDQDCNTFKGFIDQFDNYNKMYCGWHPSPVGHELWAEELYRYITVNKIL